MASAAWATRSAWRRRVHRGGHGLTVAKIEPRAIASSHRPMAGHPGSAERHGDRRFRVACRLAPASAYIAHASAMAVALKCRARVAPRGRTVTVAAQGRHR